MAHGGYAGRRVEGRSSISRRLKGPGVDQRKGKKKAMSIFVKNQIRSTERMLLWKGRLKIWIWVLVRDISFLMKISKGRFVRCLLFPFSLFAGTMQRSIKVQYDELVCSNQAMKLTMAQ